MSAAQRQLVDQWVAIVPARGGSKGLPGKNTRPLAGMPLYQHAVYAALQAGASTVVVTTDIEEILDSKPGPRVVVRRRPPGLAGDEVPMAPVVVDALSSLDVLPRRAILLQPTTPLRSVDDIVRCCELLETEDYEVVMTVTSASPSVLKYGTVEGTTFRPLRLAEYVFANRQSLPSVVQPNGAVYAIETRSFLTRRSFASDRIGCVEMPASRSVDIDDLADFMRCEDHLSSPHEETS